MEMSGEFKLQVPLSGVQKAEICTDIRPPPHRIRAGMVGDTPVLDIPYLMLVSGRLPALLLLPTFLLLPNNSPTSTRNHETCKSIRCNVTYHAVVKLSGNLIRYIARERKRKDM